MRAVLQVTGPFDLGHTLYSGQAFRWREQGGWHYGAIGCNVVKIRQTIRGLEWESTPSRPSQIRPALQRYFRLSDDMEAVYRCINKDHRMGEAVSKYHGLRLLEQDPWECLVGFLCSINSNIPRISSLLEILSRQLGEPVALDGATFYTFPEPEALASLGESGLRRLGLGFRAPFVDRIARAVAGGKLNLEGLRELPYAEAKKELMAFHGIGDKVSDCVLLFSLGKLEAFPVDRWVRRAVQEWYFNGEKPTDRTIHEWAADYFGPYAGYAEQYLFYRRRSLSKKLPQDAKQR